MDIKDIDFIISEMEKIKKDLYNKKAEGSSLKRSYIAPSKEKDVLHIRMSKNYIDRLKDYAVKEGGNISSMARKIIMEYMRNNQI